MTYSLEERRAYAKGAAKVHFQLDYAHDKIKLLREDRDYWQAECRANFNALCAMRNSINEYIPMPSLESDLLEGPEFSVSAMVIAESVISYVRERDIKYQWQQTYLYKMMEKLLTWLVR